VAPRLGAIKLRDLNPEIIVRFHADLGRAGLRDASVRKVLALLQGVLQRAVEWQRIPANPCKAVRKPSQRRDRVVRPLAPEQVERLRRHLLARGRLRDAVFISVLAYAGLRPGEALGLTWGHIRERTILVERALALGRLKTTKTGKTRTVRLLAPLAADLNEWRLAQGRPEDSAPVFPNRDGSTWSDVTWRNWRRRVFAPAAANAGLGADTRPYDLRHSFVALAPGRSDGRRGRTAGRALADDDPLHIRPSVRRARRHRNALRGGRDQARTGGSRGSRTRFVPATGSKATAPGGKTPANPRKADARTRTGDPFITSFEPLSPPVTRSHLRSRLTPSRSDWR
jgi:integrase